MRALRRILVCTRPSAVSAIAIEDLVQRILIANRGTSVDVLVATKDRTRRNTCRAVVEQYFAEEHAWQGPGAINLVVNKLTRIAESARGRMLDATENVSIVETALASMAWDTAVSCNFSYIFSSTQIERFPFGILNVHSGPLPQMAGVNPVFWSMLRGQRQHAATAHVVTPEIDGGPIIRMVDFELDLTTTLIRNRIACYQIAVPAVVDWVLAAATPPGFAAESLTAAPKTRMLPKISDSESSRFYQSGHRVTTIDDLLLLQRWLMLQ